MHAPGFPSRECVDVHVAASWGGDKMIGDPDTVRDLMRSVGVDCKRAELAELCIKGIVYTAVIDGDVLAAVLVEQDG